MGPAEQALILSTGMLALVLVYLGVRLATRQPLVERIETERRKYGREP